MIKKFVAFGLVFGLLFSGLAFAAYPASISYARSGWTGIDSHGNLTVTAFPNARVVVRNSDNYLFTVYSYYTATNKFSIYYASSSNGGASWYENKPLYVNTNNCTFPTIAVDSQDYLHVAFARVNATSSEVEIGYMNNTAGSWATPTFIALDGWNFNLPAIAINSSDVAQIVYQGRNTTWLNYCIFYTNSSKLTTSTVLEGDDTPETSVYENYLYPSIDVNASDYSWVSYTRWQNLTDLFNVGVLHYDEKTVVDNCTFGYNQSRNACIIVSPENTTNNVPEMAWLAYKCYNSTAHTSNVTLTNISCSDIDTQYHRELKNYTNETVYIYPSVSYSNDVVPEVLVSAMPTHINTTTPASSWNFLEWWLYDHNTGTVTQNDTVTIYVSTDAEVDGLAIFAHLRGSYNNYPIPQMGDMIILGFVGISEDAAVWLWYTNARGGSTSGDLNSNIFAVLEEWIPAIVLFAFVALVLALLGITVFNRRK